MDLLIVMGCVVVITFGVVLWLFLSMRAETLKASSEEAVPITDMRELKMPEQPKVFSEDFNDSADEVKDEDDDLLKAKVRLAELEKNVSFKEVSSEENVAPSYSKEHDIRQSEGVSGAEIKNLKEELARVKDKASAQARESLAVIEKLSLEIEALKREPAEISGVSAESASKFEELKIQNQELREQLGRGAEAALRFEQDLAFVKRQMGDQLKASEETILRLETEAEHLKQSKADFEEGQRSQLESVKADYQAKIQDIKSQLGKLIDTHQALQMEKDQMEGRFSSLDSELETKVEIFEEQIRSLTESNQNAQTQKERLQMDVKKLRELNASLIEKNNILQYELTKSSAQSVGLSRLCENFQLSMDDLFKRVGSAEEEKKTLSERQKRLEESLVAVETEKESLQQSQKEAQVKLAKSSEQISNLEKVYAEFRNRLRESGDAS